MPIHIGPCKHGVIDDVCWPCTLERVVDNWRKQANDWAGTDDWAAGKLQGLEDCANEIAALLPPDKPAKK